MRVAVVSRLFAPEPAAAAFRLAAVVDEFVARGVEVDVLTSRYAGAPRAEQRGSLRIRRAPVKRSRDGSVRGYLSYLSFDLPLLFRLMVVRSPDVVLVEPPPTTGLVAVIVCSLRRVPLVWYAADVWSDAAAITGAPRFITRALARVEAWVMRRAAAVLAVSEGVADRVHSLSGRTAVVVGNGVDTSVFALAPAHGSEEPSRTFVYAGTSSEFQGAGIFLDALRVARSRHQDARLVILGGGQDLDALTHGSAAFEPGTVTVLSRQSPDVAARYLAQAVASLASIVPDVGYDFAVPTKIFASAACGTPVIFAGPDAAAARVVRSAPFGWAVAYDAESIGHAMIDAIDSRERLTKGGAELAEWAERTGSLGSVARRVADTVEAVSQRRTS